MIEISPLHPETWYLDLEGSTLNTRGIAWAINPDTFEPDLQVAHAPLEMDLFDW